MREMNETLATAEARGPALMRNFSRGYVAQWVQALKPQLLRESSAQLMLKAALQGGRAKQGG